MMARGRPKVKPLVPLLIWVMVELLRDRRDQTKERASVREAARRLEQHLGKSFTGGRRIRAEAIRDHYKSFQTTAHRSNSGAEAALASNLLDSARRKRDLYGWETDTWVLVMPPEAFKAAGYQVVINDKVI
jgi:hypothetical protein